MWDFTPYETDEYVSAEDDAVELEHERERKHFREASYEPDGQPEFAQEYESIEDVYAEQEAEVGDE